MQDLHTPVVRKAGPADVPAIARVHVDSWRTTYRDIVPEEHLAKLSYEEREKIWTGIIFDPAQFTFVALLEEKIVGFANGGRNRGGEAPYHGELYSIYLLQAQQQRGLGRHLAVAICRELEKAGLRSLIVWVLRDNPAGEFYLKLGGRQIGSKAVVIGGKALEEVAYGWDDVHSVTKRDR